MPLYEFKCECGQVTEKLCKMGTEESKCTCGKTAKLQMSLGAFKLEGTGWYATDFKNRNQPGS